MKDWLIRNQARLVWFTAALGVAAITFIFATNIFTTEDNVIEIEQTIKDVEADLERERQLREERLIGYTTCLLQTPIEGRTDERIADCREASGLSRTAPEQPAIRTSEGTESSARGSVPSNQSSGTSSSGQSFSNSTPVAGTAQRESSQGEQVQPDTTPETEEPQPEPSVIGNVIKVIQGLVP